MEETEKSINDIHYWNDRFQEDWETKGGREQSAFFSAVAFQYLPAWIKQYITKEQPSFCDWGCALGDGTDFLRRALMLTNIAGIDFSSEAIKKARSKYPEIEFFDCDLTTDTVDKKFNIVFSSNTIEHFYHPWETLKKIVPYADQHMIVMIPFKEYDVCSEEHFSTFDFHSLPQLLDGEFILTHAQVIDTSKKENTSWLGLQMLLIYTHRTFISDRKLSLEDIRIETAELYNERSQRNRILAELNIINKELQSYTSQNAQLTTALLEKDAFINNILQQNEEISKQLFAIKCELIEKERKISDAELMLQTCNKEIACANDRNSVLQKNLEETTAALTDSLNKEKESNERRIASQAEELKSFIDQSSRLTLEIEKLETALNQKAKELEEQEYNTRLTITQLTDYQSGYKKLQQELETTKASLDFVSAEKNNLIAELDNTYRHLELFKQENEEIKNKLTDSTAQNNALLKEITVQQNKNKSLQLAFQEMVQSRSWRFTKPLRLFYSLFK